MSSRLLKVSYSFLFIGVILFYSSGNLYSQISLKSIAAKSDSLIEVGNYHDAYQLLAPWLGGEADRSSYDHLIVAKINHSAGICLSEEGKFEEAIMHLEIAEREYLLQDEKSLELGELYIDMGEVFLYLDGKAVLRCVDKVFENFGENEVVSGKAYALKAFLETYAEDYKSAKTDFEKARIIFENHLPKEAIEFSNFYDKYADYCRKIGDLYNAELYSKQALSIFLMYKKPEHIHALGLLNNHANDLKNTRDFKNAVTEYKIAESQLLKNYGPKFFRLGNIYNNLGACYFEMQEFSQSLDYFLKAVDIKKSWAPRIFGIQLIDLAFNYQALDNGPMAVETFQKAYDILGGLEERSLIIHKARIFNGMGWEMEKQDSLFEARQYYEKALKELNVNLTDDNFPVPFFSRSANTLRIMTRLANANFRIHHQTGQMEHLFRAFGLFRRTIVLLDEIKDNFGDPESRQDIFGQSLELFDKAIESSLELYDKTKDKYYFNFAFRVAEKSKNYLLLEIMKEKKILELSFVPDSLVAQGLSLRKRASFLEEELFLNKDTVLREAEYELFQVKKGLIENRDQIHGFIKQFDISDAPEDDIKLFLFQRDNAQKWIIEYFVGIQYIYAFVFSRDSSFVKKTPIDFSLKETIRKFRAGIFSPFSSGSSGEKISNQLAIQYLVENGFLLFEKLLLPLGELPENLTIIPDGMLGYIPFEALLSSLPEDGLNFRTYPFLINNYTISYSYSASLLQEMVQKKNLKAGIKNALAMAPFYRQGLSVLENEDEKYLGELPRSSEVCKSVCKLFGGDIKLGTEATKQQFLDLAPNYRILHLSTHGEANNNDGDFSFLAFADSLGPRYQPLFVNELYHLKLNADLVTLSACETGIGELKRGEGIISLARAFAFAGTKSILTTLWKTNDESSELLLNDFYKEIKKGEPKDKALKTAKMQYLKNPDHKGEILHPYFWAGFIGIGDMSPFD